MKFVRTLSCVALLASCALAPASSHASRINPAVSGDLCSSTTSNDPNSADPNSRVGVVRGGPVVGYDADSPTSVAEVYIFCTIQVGGSGRHSAPDTVRLESEGIYAAAIAPTVVRYEVDPPDTEFLCTEIWIGTSDGHVSIYYDGETGVWMSDPGNAVCPEAISVIVPAGGDD